MAGVFMLTVSTLVLCTGFTAGWNAVVGYVSAAIMILGSQFFGWTLFLFPVWVFVISANILMEEFRRPAVGREASAASGP
jgi:hypothetical protein